MKQIYLDNSATTQISEQALEAYIQASRTCFANPSSLHAQGVAAEEMIKQARAQLRRALGATDGEIVFTASGTESNNLAILGRAYSKERYKRGARILTTSGEHSSVREPLSKLSHEGFTVVEIPTAGGRIDMGVLEEELGRGDCILVTMMLVNNETGALYDLGAVSALMHKLAPEAVLHVDATQAFLKVAFTPKSLGADLITVSSHKVEGPKGVGALYVSERVLKTRGLCALMLGGGQERGLRPGTENVPAICAFGVAAGVSRDQVAANARHMEQLRSYLVTRLSEELPEISVTEPARHAPHILNLTLPYIKSETMLHFLSREGIYISSGSACSSNGQHHPSAALLAFGRTREEADASLRISFSHRNTREDVDALIEGLKKGISTLARFRK